MREIGFRGKVEGLDAPGFVFGSLIVLPDKTLIAVPSGNDNVLGEHTYKSCRVDPATVGQYIGVKDKRGKKVYEGDVIQTYFCFAPGDSGHGVSQRPFVVKWEQGRTAFRAFKPDTKGRHVFHILDTIDFFEMQSEVYEVIGNIHDNPELLSKVVE
jgi:uncharacterized phage protein (TIGR01671 family)